MTLKQKVVEVEHRVTHSLNMTGYGNAKLIFETMCELKGKDHNARWIVNNPGTQMETVTFIWKSKDVII